MSKQLSAPAAPEAPKAPEAPAAPSLSREALEARDKARAALEACRAAREESDKALRFYKRQLEKREALEASAEEAYKACEEAFYKGQPFPPAAAVALWEAYKEACPKGKLGLPGGLAS